MQPNTEAQGTIMSDAKADAIPTTPTPAPAVEAPKAEEKKQEVNSKAFAQIAKEQKRLFYEKQELKKAREELNTQRQALSELESLKSTAKLKPMEALKALGLDYKMITDSVLNDGNPTPEVLVNDVRSELQQLKEARAQDLKRFQDQEQNRLQEENNRTLERFNASVREFVEGEPDTYELINIHGQHDLVIATIKQHYEDTYDQETKSGKVLSTKEAAELVEKWLEGQVEKSLAAKKYKAKLSAPSAKEGEETKSQTQAKQTTTLTNNLTSTAPSLLPAKTEQERINRALAKLSMAK